MLFNIVSKSLLCNNGYQSACKVRAILLEVGIYGKSESVKTPLYKVKKSRI